MKRIRDTDCLIIDEISMISKNVFESIEAVLRSARKTSEIAGGMQVILVGDFRQLPPVPNEGYGDKGDYAFESDIFKSLIRHHVDLRQVHR